MDVVDGQGMAAFDTAEIVLLKRVFGFEVALAATAGAVTQAGGVFAVGQVPDEVVEAGALR